MDHNNLYQREYTELLERAGLGDEDFTFHSLRHTFATALFSRDKLDFLLLDDPGRILKSVDYRPGSSQRNWQKDFQARHPSSTDVLGRFRLILFHAQR